MASVVKKTKATKKPSVKIGSKAPDHDVRAELTLDARNPIPFETSGYAFSQLNNQFYIPFIGRKDGVAIDLLEARLLSVSHNACVTTKSSYCAGDGFLDSKGQPLTKPFLEWTKSMNLRNEPATEIQKKIFEDFFTWGNVPIEVVRFTVNGKKKLFVYPHSMLEWRLCPPENGDPYIRKAVHSKLFNKKNVIFRQEDFKNARTLPIYNPQLPDKDNWFADTDGSTRTLFWFKNSMSGFAHYGLPSAMASMIYQLLQYKEARFNMDQFDNNLVAATIVALKGNLSQEEADKITRKVNKTYVGDGKRGRTIFIASEEGSGITGSEMHNIDTTRDGSYLKAADSWSQNIIMANEWDAILAGLISPSTLGKGTGFLTKLQELKMTTVIKPAQRKLVDMVWNHIFKIYSDWTGDKLDAFDLNIKNAIDISGLTDVDITPAVMVNEVREAKGLQPDPRMKGIYMKSTAPADPTDPADPKNGGGNVPD